MTGNLAFLRRERPRASDPQCDAEFVFHLACMLERIHPPLTRREAGYVARYQTRTTSSRE